MTTERLRHLLTLDGLGVVLMDGPEGTRWRMRVE